MGIFLKLPFHAAPGDFNVQPTVRTGDLDKGDDMRQNAYVQQVAMSQNLSSGSGFLGQDKGEGKIYLLIQNREPIAASQISGHNYQIKPYHFNVISKA